MTKRDELAAAAIGAGPLGRSADDEPVFVLCARDPLAASFVRQWAFQYEFSGGRPAKVAEALALANQMEAWRARQGGQ